jgi:hypothetical protein
MTTSSWSAVMVARASARSAAIAAISATPSSSEAQPRRKTPMRSTSAWEIGSSSGGSASFVYIRAGR